MSESPAKRKSKSKTVARLFEDEEFITKLKEEFSGAVLSDFDILNEMADGHVVINPFTPSNLNSCSYDITLGEYYYTPNSNIKFINPHDPVNVHKYWGTAKTATKATKNDPYNIEEGKRYIVIPAKGMILSHSAEFAGANTHITTMLRTRSTLARSNIDLCGSAGWGDIGYINRWTFAIKNYNDIPVVLVVGERVGQIVFLSSSQPKKVYDGQYQDDTDIEEVKKNWDPNIMLPALKGKNSKHEKKDESYEDDEIERERNNERERNDKVERNSERERNDKVEKNETHSKADSKRKVNHEVDDVVDEKPKESTSTKVSEAPGTDEQTKPTKPTLMSNLRKPLRRIRVPK